MADLCFYVADLETNGLKWSEGFHEICELSMVRASDRSQLSRQVRVDNPQNSSMDALEITGKTIPQLRKGISKEQLIQEVNQFIEEDTCKPTHRCLVGHNIINFDRKFLWQHWEQFNQRFPCDLYLDTMQMFREFAKTKIGKKVGVNLIEACEVMGLKKYGSSHNARDDTRNTYLLWQELIKQMDFLPFLKNLPHETS